jgi:hypothetical protein
MWTNGRHHLQSSSRSHELPGSSAHVSDTTGEPIVPRPQKARAARRRKKKRRGTPRPNLDAINARRREEAAARRALLTGGSNRENPAHPTIEEFVTGRQYLGLRPTPYQLTLQKAMYGLALTDQELEPFVYPDFTREFVSWNCSGAVASRWPSAQATGPDTVGRANDENIRRLVDERAIHFSSASNAMTQKFTDWYEQPEG